MRSPDCEEAEVELTVATISNYNQGCLLLFLDSRFAVTAPHGDANRITADSSGALHINLLGKKKKKHLPALFPTWRSSQKPKARSYSPLQEQIKIHVCRLRAAHQRAARPQNTSFQRRRVQPGLPLSSTKSIGPPDVVKGTEAPPMPNGSSPLLNCGRSCASRLCPSRNSNSGKRKTGFVWSCPLELLC